MYYAFIFIILYKNFENFGGLIDRMYFLLLRKAKFNKYNGQIYKKDKSFCFLPKFFKNGAKF